jgi:hypothetical protein
LRNVPIHIFMGLLLPTAEKPSIGPYPTEAY